MQIFPVIIKECPKYSINIMADTEERAIRAAIALYANRGEGYFKQNGTELKEECAAYIRT